MSFYADIKNIGPKNWIVSWHFAGIDETIINFSLYPYTKQEAKKEGFNQFKKYLAENKEKVATFINERRK